MMMMALPELNIDLLMMTMLVIWITMHLNSQGFDEPPAPYLRSIPFLFSAVLLMFGLAFLNNITPPPGLQVYWVRPACNDVDDTAQQQQSQRI